MEKRSQGRKAHFLRRSAKDLQIDRRAVKIEKENLPLIQLFLGQGRTKNTDFEQIGTFTGSSWKQGPLDRQAVHSGLIDHRRDRKIPVVAMGFARKGADGLPPYDPLVTGALKNSR